MMNKTDIALATRTPHQHKCDQYGEPQFAIKVDSISFGYNPKKPPLLDDFSLNVPKGKEGKFAKIIIIFNKKNIMIISSSSRSYQAANEERVSMTLINSSFG